MTRLLLDTCTFVWLVAEPRKLGRAAKKAIDAAETLVLSDVTALEVCLKWRAGKLRLPEPPRRWITEQAEAWHVEWLSLRQEHMFRASELEPIHADPYDRLLVAQALSENLRIVTPDEGIARYPVSTLW
ncbi:MAG: type II toxin-antitoxin system VapC family toxin [Deltaproteobacteria bacterium]|nr:type II toxin-antitoxin system VapC family toxin [Deltaproteobacteria bacterium]